MLGSYRTVGGDVNELRSDNESRFCLMDASGQNPFGTSFVGHLLYYIKVDRFGGFPFQQVQDVMQSLAGYYFDMAWSR